MIATRAVRLALVSVLVALFRAAALAQPPQTAAESAPAADHSHHHHDPGPNRPPDDAPRVSAPSEPAEPPGALPPFIPVLTDADRQAAFPQVEGHAVHDSVVTTFFLFDQLEWRANRDRATVNLDVMGWVGGDRNRVWLRADGHETDGQLADAEMSLLYGRRFSRWWDFVGGVRQTARPGPAETWAAVGVQGLAPYWFEVEATAFVGTSGRTQLRFSIEYDLLLTNRLIFQPLWEVELHGRSAPERGIGAGLSKAETGLRLRYEFRREFAPYVGVIWNHKYGKTADMARAAGEPPAQPTLTTGLRLWF